MVSRSSFGTTQNFGRGGAGLKAHGACGFGLAACCEDAALPFRNSAVIRPGYALYSGLVASNPLSEKGHSPEPSGQLTEGQSRILTTGGQAETVPDQPLRQSQLSTKIKNPHRPWWLRGFLHSYKASLVSLYVLLAQWPLIYSWL